MSGRRGRPAITQPQTNTRRSIGIKLTVIARQLRLKFDQSVQRSGLTRAKWSLIAAVARNPGATQRSIAAMLEVREVTAGRLIDRLCADGYLERRENPSDRRAYCVYLTPATRPMLDILGQLAKEHEEHIFAGFSEEDLVRLDELLDKVASNLAGAPAKRQTGKQGRQAADASTE